MSPTTKRPTAEDSYARLERERTQQRAAVTPQAEMSARVESLLTQCRTRLPVARFAPTHSGALNIGFKLNGLVPTDVINAFIARLARLGLGASHFYDDSYHFYDYLTISVPQNRLLLPFALEGECHPDVDASVKRGGKRKPR